MASTATLYGIYILIYGCAGCGTQYCGQQPVLHFTGEGLIYALYNNSSDSAQYYYNTVSLDNTASASSSVTRGFYQLNQATGIDVKNNIFTMAVAAQV
jgi:hypothetical protein